MNYWWLVMASFPKGHIGFGWPNHVFWGLWVFAKPNHNFNRLWSLRSKSSFSSISRQNGRNGLNISFLLEEKYIFQIVISLENSSNCIIHKLKSAKPSHFDEIFSHSNFTWKNRHLPWIFLAYWDFFLFADPDFFWNLRFLFSLNFFIELYFLRILVMVLWTTDD